VRQCGVSTSASRSRGWRAIELASLRRTVGAGSLVYLALPVGVFLAGWLWPGWAVLVVAGLLTGVAIWARRLWAADRVPEESRPVPVLALAGAALAVIAVVALSGPGGFGEQTWDWGKHNAILKDLIEQRWPVAYATGRSDVILTYYVAYYLPAALVGKAAGWTAANVGLFAWSALGAVLAFLWLVVLSGAPVWRCLLIFVFFSGLDMVGAALWSTRWTDAAWMDDFSAEWWVNRWVYPNNLTLLAFAPHQALGGWLLTGLALDGLWRYPGRAPHVLGGALGLLWSPFATLGLLGLAGLDWATAWRARGGVRGLARDGAELAGLLTALVLAAYLLSQFWPMALPPEYYPSPARFEVAAFTFLPARLPVREFGADYAVFVTLEFLLLAALLAVAYRRHPRERRLLGAVTAMLLILPLFRYGFFNDLVMRASIPALFALQALAARVAEVVPRRSALALAVTAVLVLGAVYPANMLRLRLEAAIEHRVLVWIPRKAAVTDLFQQQLAMRSSFPYLMQYIGAADAPFFRFLARRPVPVPKGSPAAR
jgi:hypothetical protein